MVGLIDLDGIVANLLTPWVGWLNQHLDAGIEVKDILDYNVAANLDHKVRDRAFEFLNLPGVFRSLAPLPGALDGLLQLRADGHRLLIASAYAREPETATDKLLWVQQHLPWIPRQDVYLCHAKERIKADFIIDDSPSNMTQYRRHWPEAKILTIAYPYNHTPTGICDLRAESWEDTETAWSALTHFLRR
jgi:5'(3')-deoxyribonucleotidase